MVAKDKGPEICDKGGSKGFVLPFSIHEYEVNNELRATLYGIALVYFFLGVSIVADTFMGSIEVITSRRRQVMLSSGKIITVRVWNDTVANLTLMALGSSAPEILLAVTELLKKKMYSGELGPATIVGSASFNLLMIVGLCIFVIPSNETRKVREVPVFIVTVLFMFAAYIWLVLIVSVISPEEIEPWEALVTLALLPILVWVSYLADIGKFGDLGKHIEVRDYEVDRVCNLLGTMDRNDKRAIRDGLSHHPHFVTKLENPTSADIDELRKMVKKFTTATQSRAARRINATRGLTGGRRILWELTPSFGLLHRVSGVSGHVQDTPVLLPKGKGPPIVQFAVDHQTLSARHKTKRIVVNRSGDCAESIIVNYVVGSATNQDEDKTQSTTEYSAPAMQRGWSAQVGGSMFFGNKKDRNSKDSNKKERSMGRLSWTSNMQVYHRSAFIFEAEERHKILDVDVPQACTKDFAVVLTKVRQNDGTLNKSGDVEESVHSVNAEMTSSMKVSGEEIVSLGAINRTVVTIADVREAPNRLAFAYERVLVTGSEQQQCLEVMVHRLDGCTGTVSCSYRTETLTGVPGYDYVETSGTLEFPEGITERFIELEILPKGRSKKKEEFLLVLEEPHGKVEFNPRNDGGSESEILTVVIAPRKSVDGKRTKVFTLLDEAFHFNEIRLGSHDYASQFRNAIYCNGSREEQAEASVLDWVFHILALPWKLVFMFIPPTTYFHGWLCFWSSLVFIGGLTALIGDIAEIFGCCLGFTNLITAISFVALGTSMPDLFASKVAATQDDTADASIVNVTGSNSVNVFLGLGMPWSIGALYWRCKDYDSQWAAKYPDFYRERNHMAFMVPSGDLGLSVAVFNAVAVLALLILFVRRRQVGAELGGEFKCKVASSVALALLWVAYLFISGWWSLRQDDAETPEIIIVFCISGGVAVVPCIVAIGFAMVLKRPLEEEIRRSSKSSSREGSTTMKTTPSNGGSVLAPNETEQSLTTAAVSIHTENGTEKESKVSKDPEAPSSKVLDIVEEGIASNKLREDTHEPMVANESAKADSKTLPTPLTAPPAEDQIGLTPIDEEESCVKEDRTSSRPPVAEEGRPAAEVRVNWCGSCCLTASTSTAETVTVVAVEKVLGVTPPQR